MGLTFFSDQTLYTSSGNTSSISARRALLNLKKALLFFLSLLPFKGKRGHNLHCLGFIWLVDLLGRPQKRGPISRPRVGTLWNPFVRYACAVAVADVIIRWSCVLLPYILNGLLFVSYSVRGCVEGPWLVNGFFRGANYRPTEHKISYIYLSTTTCQKKCSLTLIFRLISGGIEVG